MAARYGNPLLTYDLAADPADGAAKAVGVLPLAAIVWRGRVDNRRLARAGGCAPCAGSCCRRDTRFMWRARRVGRLRAGAVIALAVGAGSYVP